MVYTAHSWVEQSGDTGSTKAGWLDNMETQYHEICDYSDETTHDTLYYTKTYCTATYFSATKQGTGSGFVCERLDGYTGDQLLSMAIAPYTIVLWNSDVNSIPSGWHLCDGRNSYTPDLRNRFVIGAGGSYALNSTGGSNTVASTAKTVTIGTHTLTTDEIPNHAHTGITDYYTTAGGDTPGSGAYIAEGNTITYENAYTGYTGGGGAHGHTGSTLTGAGTTGNNMPPYIAICYMIKEP